MANESTTISGSQALDYCTPLRAFVEDMDTSDSVTIPNTREAAEISFIFERKIASWVKNERRDHHRIWAYSIYGHGEILNAQFIERTFLYTAVEMFTENHSMTKPCIAHICEVPQLGSMPEFKGTRTEAGLLGIVYSLILQLLEIKSGEEVHLNMNELKKLGEDIAHWDQALKVLEKIYGQTEVVYCLISALNDLEGEA